ncbi:MAG: deoxyribonucleoside 5'-monophosphate N-glycosidase [Leptolinea sp.]|nr:deoxyribonucleoside 5'-monophosphate N-glycosidase [Leptolinea sp.]
MNIYFSCSITGGRKDQPDYERLVNALMEDGHIVPTAHLADADILSLEKVVKPQEVYHRDVEWVTHCNILVAEVSTPSHGVGYEIALAESLGKPVFCCYREGSVVSKMILGNTSPGFRVFAYKNIDEAIREVRVFLKSLPGL